MHLYPYTSLFLTASAVIVPLQPRANTNDPCAVNPSGVGDLGPTVDGAAGIGAEFESPAFYFTNPECSPEDTFAAKGKIVNGRTGDQWILSADTGGNEGKLNAEYILNGKKIKVGSGDGAKSGREVANDLIGWKPWQGDDKAKEINIQDNKCNPWKVTAPSAKSAPEKLPWLVILLASVSTLGDV
ncbi:MAG: hypothetical protein LQ351_008135 [Letrouitia transgressa]|nr:MAG: hypothetical protein LQ351_008135 [Letrouitia transgressa]